jgi:antitoxin component YwqK of YwqJK toxin-antitoxin module
LNGKEISENEFEEFFYKQQEAEPSTIAVNVLPKLRSSTDLSDAFIQALFNKKREMERKSFFNTLKRFGGNFPDTEKCDSVSRNLFSYSFFGSYPNSGFYDTLACRESGKILRTATIKKGRLNGPLKYYFLNGSLACVFHFSDDALDGKFVSYHENGKIEQRGHFLNGIAVDTLFEYSENGALIFEKIFNGTDAYTKNYYWADDHKLQRREVKAGEKLSVVIRSDSGVSEKEIRVTKDIQKYFFDKEGNEISEKKFDSTFPGIIKKDKVARVQF